MRAPLIVARQTGELAKTGGEDAIAKWQTFIAYLDQAVRIADSGRIDAPPSQNCN